MPSADEVAAAVWNYDAGGEEGTQQAKHLLSQARTASRTNAAHLAVLTAVVSRMADALATAGGVDADDLKRHISGEVDRAMDTFRERVVEGYDVKLSPKGDAPSA